MTSPRQHPIRLGHQLALNDGFGERWTRNLFAVFLGGRAEELGRLDRLAGDGDFGNNISAALDRARRAAAAEEAGRLQGYPAWLTCVSRGFLGTGGTSGPLFGMFFRDLARCTTSGEPTLTELSAGLSAGVATVQRYGGAEVGHKTMVDALVPAARTLESQLSAAAAPDEALGRTALAAVEGARSTASLIARRGRASYVGEVARGVLDPGAAAAAIILQAAAVAQAGGDGVDTAWIEV
ncbi:DAK2 domain-containing protein [Streptomyces sp. NPDC093085]|uniref:DAK2 domain-containing protein n=1 Tax=Streptomyces sp. NPDC093085 TaxID=3155068 RepID=UPI003434A760